METNERERVRLRHGVRRGDGRSELRLYRHALSPSFILMNEEEWTRDTVKGAQGNGVHIRRDTFDELCTKGSLCCQTAQSKVASPKCTVTLLTLG